ncbi:hypothetical protein ECG_08416 [Echinococcus granulosus]|uniref:Expressed conserved protein n=1 Tax=Echinococcus granulosus TaxID=6210 RepID=A0A068WLM2_ECHGR|nr:hypothetical protein ECG_08416 [Echinococcus granulosus]CDS21023.1 hypothetical protein EgrG_000539700 [Echinococcus granulosus]
MSQIDDKPGSAAQTSDPASSPNNPLQGLSAEKRQLLTNLLLLLTAHHRQQKLASQQIEKASSSQQYPPIKPEFDCRPFKGPKTPPTPTQPPLPPSPPSSPLPRQEYASHPPSRFRRPLDQGRQFNRPFASPPRQRSFREPLESRRRSLRPQIRREFSNDPAVSRLRMRSVVNVVVDRRGEPQRQRSSSSARSSCSCVDCEERKKRREREDEEEGCCARTRPYQGKVKQRDPVVVEGHVEEVDSWQLGRKRRREWIPQENYRRQLPWHRRRQSGVTYQAWDFGRRGRFVDGWTAGRRGRQDAWVRERERDWGRRYGAVWRGDFY